MSTLPDHAAEFDERGLPIDRVGITDLRYPVQVLDRNQGMQATVAKLGLYVGLPHHFKGTHMSRFVEILNEVRGELTFRTMPNILEAIRRRLEADDAWLEMEFPYFMMKKAPVSGAESLMEYQARFVGHRGPDSGDSDYTLGVTVPVKSLCPCSKAVSDYGAHNQRSLVSVDVRADDFVWLEDIIEAVEACASAPLYALLKRSDEKYVTEQAYDNPKFVEDLVRDVVLAVRDLPGVHWLKVRASNQESIHNHNATAEIEWTRDDDSVVAEQFATNATEDAPSFGSWLRDQRVARKLSQKALAESLSLSASHLSRLESDDKAPSAELLDRLAGLWGLDPVTLHLRAGRVPDSLLAAIARDPEGFRAWAG
jgi:GTP cyclohydrolase I